MTMAKEGLAPADKVRVSQVLFFSILWSSVAICLCLVALRFGIRWKLFRKLFWDDALVAFALLMFLAQSISWSINADGLWLAYDVATGRVFPTATTTKIMLENLKVQLGALCLFFAAIWSIKAAFLIFFRRIGDRVQGYKLWYWWAVTGIVAITFIISMALLPYRCLTGSAEYIITKCVKPKDVNYYYSVFYMHMAFDIATDVLLMTIPALYLWNVKIPLRQKLGLMGLFSLTICVIAVALVRLCLINKKVGVQQSAAWVALWTVVEITMALIVVCLGSFRQLFTRSGNKSSRGGGSSNRNSSSKPSMVLSVKDRFNSLTSKWKPAHNKTASHSELMREETAYLHDYEERAVESKIPEVEVIRTELPRSEVPLKRASQAHIAHYSAAPTERRYMVVHPGDESGSRTSGQPYNFI